MGAADRRARGPLVRRTAGRRHRGARMVRDGLGVPVVGLIVMLVPAVVIRLLRPPPVKRWTASWSARWAPCPSRRPHLTRFAPQFASGMIKRSRWPAWWWKQVSGEWAVLLTAAAVGGLIGAALWFTRPPTKAGQHTGYVRAVLALFAAAVIAVYAALGLVDVAGIPQALQLVIHLSVAVVALLLLRIGLHLALLHEAHDEIHSDEPLLCPHCDHVVPDMAFCPACGVATRAVVPVVANGATSNAADEPHRRRADHRRHTPWLLRRPPGPTPHRRCAGRRMSGCCGPGVSAIVVVAVGVGRAVGGHSQASRALRLPAGLRAPADRRRRSQSIPASPRPDGAFSVSYPAPGCGVQDHHQPQRGTRGLPRR